MSHPWSSIDLGVYEQHMSSPQVHQLQTLQKITQDQLRSYNSRLLGICGIAGGNGLDEVQPKYTDTIYAIDINRQYLDICQSRYHATWGASLVLVHGDFASPTFALPPTTLLICNLVIEYIGIHAFAETLSRHHRQLHTISCTIQKNLQTSFVSSSPLASHFSPIAALHQDIHGDDLKQILQEKSFQCIYEQIYPLPNGKEFHRLDFTV